MRNNRTLIGLFVSLVYVLVLWVVIEYFKLPRPDTINELGDFLAGAFSPLAFFWLVIGYYQQGEELQQNTQALQDQKDEFQKQVQHLDRQAAALEERLIWERTSAESESTSKIRSQQLNLVLTDFRIDSNKFKASFLNKGGDCYGLIPRAVDPNIEILPIEIKDLKAGIPIGLSFSFNPPTYYPPNIPLDFTISYRDQFNTHQTELYRVEGTDSVMLIEASWMPSTPLE